MDELQAVKEKLTDLIDAGLESKEFKSGSKGYLLLAREEIDGKKFMINVQAVEVGSKPK